MNLGQMGAAGMDGTARQIEASVQGEHGEGSSSSGAAYNAGQLTQMANM
jgi:hypothetical protein